MMKFTKMQGCGNDYVYVNCFEETVRHPEELAVRLSNRHFGIGSDGLILICPSDKADFRMAMYNMDGSEGKMCGNGVRCIAKYVYDHHLTDKTQITLETLAGIKHLDLSVENGKVMNVTVDMGQPVFKGSQIPVRIDKDMIVNEPITDKSTYQDIINALPILYDKAVTNTKLALDQNCMNRIRQVLLREEL